MNYVCRLSYYKDMILLWSKQHALQSEDSKIDIVEGAIALLLLSKHREEGEKKSHLYHF